MKIQDFLIRLGGFGSTELWFNQDETRSYHDFVNLVSAFREELRNLGIQSNDFVPVLGDSTLEGFAMLLALACEGVTVAPCTEKAFSSLLPCINKLRPKTIIKMGGKSGFRAEPFSSNRSKLGESALLAPGVPGLVVFTSGSTGTPKAILHDFNQILAKFDRPRFPHRAIPFLLFDHFGGVNTLLSLASSGGSLIQLSSRTIVDICCAIEKFKVTLLPTTPTFLSLLLISGELRNHDLSSLKLITYGTEVMSESVLRKLAAALPAVEFKQTYGLSELGVFATSSRSRDSTWIKVGGLGVATKVVDDLLWVKAESRMLGHFEFQGEDARWIEQDAEWYCTQDIVAQEGEYLKILGRETDIINVSGLKVYPGEVESCLLDCPIVLQASVSGERHALVGQIVVARIVLAQGVEPSYARKEIVQFCRDRMDRFKIPTKLVFVDEVQVSDRFKKVRVVSGA